MMGRAMPAAPLPTGIDIGTGPAAAARPSPAPERRKISVYVKVSPDVTDDTIRAVLSVCGQVSSWKRTSDPVSGQRKGFGYCEYAHPMAVLTAQRVVHGLEVGGRPVELKVSSKVQTELEALEGTFAGDREQQKQADAAALDRIRAIIAPPERDEAQQTSPTQPPADHALPESLAVQAANAGVTEEQLMALPSVKQSGAEASVVNMELRKFREQLKRDEEEKQRNPSRRPEEERERRPRRDPEREERERRLKELQRALHRVRQARNAERERCAERYSARSHELQVLERRVETMEGEFVRARRRLEERDRDEARERARLMAYAEDPDGGAMAAAEAERLEERRRRYRRRERADDGEEAPVRDGHAKNVEAGGREAGKDGAAASAAPGGSAGQAGSAAEESGKSALPAKPAGVKLALGFEVGKRRGRRVDGALDLLAADDDEDADAPAKRRKLTRLDDGERSAEELIARIPTERTELYAFPVNWAVAEQARVVHTDMKNWVTAKIKEYLGEEERTLIKFIVKQLSQRCAPTQLEEELAPVLAEDTALFVMKLWRALLFHTLQAEQA